MPWRQHSGACGSSNLSQRWPSSRPKAGILAYLPLVDTVTSELSSTRPYSGKRIPLVLGFRILADSADHLPDLADLLPPVDLPATADLDRWSDGKRSLAASARTRAKHPTQPWSSWPSGSTLRASATRSRSWLTRVPQDPRRRALPRRLQQPQQLH